MPLGVHDCCDGFNFAVFSRHAERVELLIFEDPADQHPLWALDLDPAQHRTGDIWHALVEGVRWGQAYAYRVHGPLAPEAGYRFDADARLLDPYARAVAGRGDAGVPPGDGRCLLLRSRFDWQGTQRPRTPWSDTVIYETHVRGLTIHPSSASRHPGTFLGVIDRIPYLRELGVTAIELMPVQAFHRGDAGRRNYWGYDTLAFFALEPAYAAHAAPGSVIDEFKTLVRELHRNGLEVILDVVFNHTAEGDERGPMFSFRGLDNAIYYLLGADRRRYENFSGCGNTLNCSHPVVRDFIIDCLRYWAAEMQVDGFRFDLASILGRDREGRLMADAPLLERIAEDPILRDVKLIAEAWDAGGAYQVGRFPGVRWAEWNGRFRDDVRRFWRGDAGMTGAFASRLCGSADLYQHSGKAPLNSVNFVTCHDGFTLNDLVSYARKHNEANGEGNRDGADENFSMNHGVEGPTIDAAIEARRLRQIKNLLATLLLARGVPMLLGGDEFRRSQAGNNNPWCQDNALSWYDWRLVEENGEVLRFVRGLIALRRRHPCLRNDAFYRAEELDWFGPQGHAPDWDGPTRAFGCRVRECAEPGMLCLLLNASDRPADFHLPDAPWRLEADTGQAPPGDICAPDDLPPLPDRQRYALAAGSLAVLSHL